MAKRRTPQTQAKRQREVAKKQKRQDKLERRALRKQQRDEEDASGMGETPADRVPIDYSIAPAGVPRSAPLAPTARPRTRQP